MGPQRARPSDVHTYHKWSSTEDYNSPVMRTLLMGALPSASMIGTDSVPFPGEQQRCDVVQQQYTPLFKTIVPNYRCPVPELDTSIRASSLAASQTLQIRSSAPIEAVRQKLIMSTPPLSTQFVPKEEYNTASKVERS